MNPRLPILVRLKNPSVRLKNPSVKNPSEGGINLAGNPKIGSSIDTPGAPIEACYPDVADTEAQAEGTCEETNGSFSADGYCPDTSSEKDLAPNPNPKHTSVFASLAKSLVEGIDKFSLVKEKFEVLPDVDMFKPLWPKGEPFEKGTLELDYSSYGENAQRWFGGTGMAKELAVIKSTDPARYAAIEEYFARYQELKLLLADASALRNARVENIELIVERLVTLLEEADLESLFFAATARDQGTYWEYQAGQIAEAIIELRNIESTARHPPETIHLLEVTAKKLKDAIPHRSDLPYTNLARFQERRKKLDEIAKKLDDFISELRSRQSEFERGGIGIEEASAIWRDDLRIYNENLAEYASEIAAFQAFYGMLVETSSKYAPRSGESRIEGAALLAEERVKTAWKKSGDIEELAEAYRKQINEIDKKRENGRFLNSGQMLFVGGEILEEAAKRREIYKKADKLTGEEVLEAAREIEQNLGAINRILEAAEGVHQRDIARIWWKPEHLRQEALKMAIDDQMLPIRDALSDVATGRRDWNELSENEQRDIVSALRKVDTLITSQGLLIFNAGVKGSNVGGGKLSSLCRSACPERSRGASVKFDNILHDATVRIGFIEMKAEGADAVDKYLESYIRSGNDLSESEWQRIDKMLMEKLPEVKDFRRQIRLARLEDTIARERKFLTEAKPTAEDAAKYPILFGAMNLEDASLVGTINEIPALPYLNRASRDFTSYEHRFSIIPKAQGDDEEISRLERDIDRYFKSKERHELGYRLGEDKEYIRFRSEVWFYESIAETALGGWAAGGVAGWIVNGVADVARGARVAGAAADFTRAQSAASWLSASYKDEVCKTCP